MRRVLMGAAAVVAGVLAVAPPGARAGVIVLDFQDLAVPGNTIAYYPGPYTSQGFTLNVSLGFNVYESNAGFFYAGERGVGPISPSAVELTRADGAPFTLGSIDLARNFAFDPAPTVTFTGTLAGGGTVSQSFTVTTPVGQQAFQTFAFTGFNDVTRVTWNQPPLADGLHQFTDITFVTPDQAPSVPEPATLALFGVAACTGLALRRRRR